MAEAKKRLLTYAGLKAIEDELENLKVVKRKEVAGKIKEAREHQIYRPVMLSGFCLTCSGVPAATMRPPASPPPGPISTR